MLSRAKRRDPKIPKSQWRRRYADRGRGKLRSLGNGSTPVRSRDGAMAEVWGRSSQKLITRQKFSLKITLIDAYLPLFIICYITTFIIIFSRNNFWLIRKLNKLTDDVSYATALWLYSCCIAIRLYLLLLDDWHCMRLALRNSFIWIFPYSTFALSLQIKSQICSTNPFHHRHGRPRPWPTTPND